MIFLIDYFETFFTWNGRKDVDADEEADDGQGTSDQCYPVEQLIQELLKKYLKKLKLKSLKIVFFYSMQIANFYIKIYNLSEYFLKLSFSAFLNKETYYPSVRKSNTS